MILLRRSTMLAKIKEKDVIDQLLDQIDFHGMTAEELAGENGLLTFGTAPFNGTIVASSVSLDSYKKNCQISQTAKDSFSCVKIIPTLGVHPQNAADEENRLVSYTHALQILQKS